MTCKRCGVELDPLLLDCPRCLQKRSDEELLELTAARIAHGDSAGVRILGGHVLARDGLTLCGVVRPIMDCRKDAYMIRANLFARNVNCTACRFEVIKNEGAAVACK